MERMTHRMTTDNDPSSGCPRASDRSGFSLVEVVIASMILLMTMGALLYAFTAAKDSGTRAEYSLAAMQYAREEAENIRATSWSNIAPYNLTITNSMMLMKVGGGKTCTVVTTNDYKDITVVVGWHDPATTLLRTQVYNFVISNTN